MSLPNFTSRGTLPLGVHAATWGAIVARFGGTPHRNALLAGLKEAPLSLKAAGCTLVYLDGSFVTDKRWPADFDACWSLSGVDPERLDPVLLTFDAGRKAQKAKYGGELFPAELPEGRSGRTFLEFFQTDRETGAPKGIVAIRLDRWKRR